MSSIQKYLSKRKRPGAKVERIYRVLLDIPFTSRTKYRLAKEADTDYHWTVDKLRELEELGIIEDSKVVRPIDLFTIWSSRPNPTLYREYHIQGPLEVVNGSNLDFALTTYYAEQLIGNYLFPSKFDLYIQHKDANVWHRYLSKNGYVGKGNVRILLGDEHVFWHKNSKTRTPTVSIQQLIVDLLREGGVCTEAAELLMERYYGKD